jgi:DNA polymerase-1
MTSPLATRYERARKDRLGALLAGADEAGVRFRWAGADLRMDGLGRLPQADQVFLAQHLGEITARLMAPGDTEAVPLADLGIEAIVLITDAEHARSTVRALPPQIGLDIETEAANGHAIQWPWLAVTQKGLRAVHQPQLKDKTALNPRRAQPRLVQVYDPALKSVFVIDLHHVQLDALAELWTRRLWIHNAAFELAMLGARGVSLPATIDTQQMAGLLFGCRTGSRRLESVAEQVLEVPLDKTEQLSDWSAPRLSRAQIEYAAIDAAVAYRAGRAMWRQMDEQLRRCFRVQNEAVPVIAKMRLAGVPFARDIHLETIEGWERELAEKRANFVELTGEEPPARHRVGAWIEAHLPAEEIAWMPRTKAGGLSARGDLLKYLAQHEEIRPLLRVLWARKRLENFGHSLIELIDPTISRIYPDYMPCGAKTGRLTSSKPNGQQLPRDGRGAIVAPEGRLLVCGDLDQIELRVFAEQADEQVMRSVFAVGGDIHRRTASSMSGVPEDEIGKKDPRRTAAKAVNFGIVFAAGARTIRASAWSKFDIDMSLKEADDAKAAVLRTYPAILPYQQRQAELGLNARVIHSVSGRPLRADWEKNSELKYTTCSNFPVQSSAADIMLRSMVLLDRALMGLDAQLILSVHDELVVETEESVAEEVKRHLIAAMTEAFCTFFPTAPYIGLVETYIVNSWGKTNV